MALASALSSPRLGEPIQLGGSGVEKRLAAARQFLDWRGARVADIGCGNGAYTEVIARDAASVIGIDLQRPFLAAYRQRSAASGPGATVAQSAAERLPLRDGAFDAVFCIETLEHVADETQALAELRRILRPGGHVVLTVPNKWFLFETHGLRVGPVTGNRIPFISWLPKAVHSRIAAARIYRLAEVRRILLRAGFDDVRLDYVMPPLDKVRSPRARTIMRRIVGAIERSPLRVFGVSVVAVARKPA